MLFFEILKDVICNHIPVVFWQICIFFTRGWKAVVDYRHRSFSALLKDFPEFYNTKVADRKRILFQSLNTIVSSDPELKRKGQIRILEIGVGTGANLEFYPAKCHLIVVDPNKYFESSIRSNVAKYAGITLNDFVIGAGEDMNWVESESVDAVVTTLVTCSVKNLDNVLKEIRRVLIPGGFYCFMEHVCFESNNWKFWIQKILNILQIWPLLFDGCVFQSRNRMRDGCKKYFTRLEKYDEFFIDPSGFWGLHLCSPHVSGIGVK